MSFGDEHGYGDPARPARNDDGFGGTGQTRTRLPDARGGDGYGGGRRPARGSRSLIMVVGVVVLLLAAIAFANRGGNDDPATGANAPDGAGNPTAASGVKPVTGKNGTIPSGFAKDEQGAASAATNYAVALGSDGMFNRVSRYAILDAIYVPASATKLKTALDPAYAPAELQRLGLDAEGNPPPDSLFVSRAIPVGTKVESISGDTARVSVWYTGLIGMAGPGSTDPVKTTWQTGTFDLRWQGDDWKIVTDTQKTGPAPVPGDVATSGADEISKAVEQYGGFTYAR
ncbi:hypothetical protein [Streptomyces liangshanensis]|uniref:DUF8175 domain-containing protein n=1 Tax=Streptomyces liangshanensis TaxID=2717324 RepID=A0A6G9H1K8_9ACTN|nr:hypothetical protein [Streptomyces liangshanensis]QIQ04017.1 hypothetical protein HA039_18380 [Streptomyces liangshanensis]